MNITDIDDKIIRGAAAAGDRRSASSPTATLGALPRGRPDAAHDAPDVLPRATEHIDQMAALIADAARQAATPTGPTTARSSSGSRRVAGVRAAGAARPRAAAGRASGSRADEYAKDDVRDFALWKGPKPGEPSLGDGDRAGPARLAHRVLGDEHGATSGRRSTSTPAASTSSSRTTRTRSPRARRRPASRSSGPGCTAPTSRWAARRWPSRPGTSPGSASCSTSGVSPRALRYALDRGPLPRRGSTTRTSRWPRPAAALDRLDAAVARARGVPRGPGRTTRTCRRSSRMRRTAFGAALDDDLNVSAATRRAVRPRPRAQPSDRGPDRSRRPTRRTALATLRDLDQVLGVLPDAADDLDADALAHARRREAAARGAPGLGGAGPAARRPSGRGSRSRTRATASAGAQLETRPWLTGRGDDEPIRLARRRSGEGSGPGRRNARRSAAGASAVGAGRPPGRGRRARERPADVAGRPRRATTAPRAVGPVRDRPADDAYPAAGAAAVRTDHAMTRRPGLADTGRRDTAATADRVAIARRGPPRRGGTAGPSRPDGRRGTDRRGPHGDRVDATGPPDPPVRVRA